MVIFAIVCCNGNSLQYTHMNENGIPGVLLIFTVNARSLHQNLKQILYFQFVILFQVQILLKLQGATLSDLDEKITFAGYERHPKGNSETSLSCLKIYLPFRVSHENRKYSLTLDNFSLSSQQLVQLTFFILAKVLTSILAQFSTSKHSSATRRHFAIVETRLKSWKRRTVENYSRSIVMLLT